MTTLLAAVMFLTRVRVPTRARRVSLAQATAWFPVVGAALGLAAAGVAHAVSEIPAVPSMFSALLLVTLGAWITGAIHLDGLADAADGFGGGRSSEQVLRIMRDPRTGSFGALALIVVVGAKTIALATLIDREADMMFLIAAPAMARWTVLPLNHWLPYARAGGGLGARVAGGRSGLNLAVGSAAAGVISAVALGRLAAGAWVTVALITLAIGAQARRRIGGVTGDVYGACVELAETGVLVTGMLLT